MQSPTNVVDSGTSDAQDGRHLRGYQEDLKTDVNEEFDKGARRVIVQLGTGGGKTKTASSWLHDLFAEDPDLVVGWLVHTQGLRTQAADEMHGWGMDVIDWSTVHHSRRVWTPGRVHAFGATMTIPRMIRKARTVLVLDECHRSAATTVTKQIEHARWHRVLGLSATPARLGWPDRISDAHARFARQWDAVVCGPPLTELVAQGALAEVIMRSPRDAGGDRSVLRSDRRRESGYSADSEAAFEKSLSLDAAVGHTSTLSSRPTIWFCGSKRAANRLGRLLPRSAVVIAETPEHVRKRHYGHFCEGVIDNIISVGVLVEGVDLPNASRVVLLRPSSSRTLLAQQCGRGMRPPGNVEIIDFAGSFADLGAHPLDPLPWHDSLSGRIPDVTKYNPSKPKICPAPGCETMLGPRHGRLCPTCSAEVGRWCVACERSLTGIEDGAHRRCKGCASSERALHARWAEIRAVVPVLDKDAADDFERPAASAGQQVVRGAGAPVSAEQARLIAILDQQAADLEKAAAEARNHADRAKASVGVAAT